ncbi:MAG: hypothetical protein DYG84_08230 [Candidatus Brocadia sp. AMX3]|nr:hypothetical protein [Candidatus Brocadia sp. AMX3]OQZ01725.1 MAG: hypothetical protein B6D35_02445 [Candidatus Brocadia sp. UTAMX2]
MYWFWAEIASWVWTKILQVECLNYNKEATSLASLFQFPFTLILFLVNDIKSKNYSIKYLDIT